jgi:hypothetical protein
MKSIPEGVFKPASRPEEKVDATTKAARDIIDGEAAARDAKTERLRTARLAKEAMEPAPVDKRKTAKKK